MQRVPPVLVAAAIAMCALLGCAEKDPLDSDSPWPARGGGGEGEGEGEGDGASIEAFVDQSPVLADRVVIGDTGVDAEMSELSVTVAGDVVEVSHSNVLLAPCDDFSISGTVDATNMRVEANYANEACGELSSYTVSWTFPTPDTAGDWTLEAESDEVVFTVE